MRAASARKHSPLDEKPSIGMFDRRPVERTSSEHSMLLYVVTTTVDGTRAALMSAAALGRDLDARTVVLVPHVVPYTDPLDRPTDSIAAAGDRFRRLAEALGMQAEIRVCLCRSHSRSLMPLLPLDGVILVGGRRRRWWLTREQRLLAELTNSGRRAMFIELFRSTEFKELRL